jgi:hypothetical protein
MRRKKGQHHCVWVNPATRGHDQPGNAVTYRNLRCFSINIDPFVYFEFVDCSIVYPLEIVSSSEVFY